MTACKLLLFGIIMWSQNCLKGLLLWVEILWLFKIHKTI